MHIYNHNFISSLARSLCPIQISKSSSIPFILHNNYSPLPALCFTFFDIIGLSFLYLLFFQFIKLNITSDPGRKSIFLIGIFVENTEIVGYLFFLHHSD